MERFFNYLVASWWGIFIICVVSVALWTVLSCTFYKCFFKRFYDVVLSATALIVLSPVLLVLTCVNAVVMKGNPFFIQRRPGKISKKTGEEKIFKLIKFRTMSNAKDENGNLLPDEKRLTKYGKFLRSTSLDELPELINVFLGQMSLVGPRPLIVKDLVFMSNEIRCRHDVLGGITGLAQVNGRNSIGWDEKFEYDLQYIQKISLLVDIKILLLTVFKVLKRSDITREGTESDLDYGDWLLQENKISEQLYYRKIKNL